MSKKFKKQKEEIFSMPGIVHILHFHIYFLYFFVVMLGVLFDVFFSVKVFSGIQYQYIGMLMIMLGTFIIFWSKSTSKNSRKSTSPERDLSFFFQGPYKFIRNPINFGLTFMSVGLGFLVNSLFSVVFILSIYIYSRFFFTKKEYKILEEKYGQGYKDYLKKVKDWL